MKANMNSDTINVLEMMSKNRLIWQNLIGTKIPSFLLRSLNFTMFASHKSFLSLPLTEKRLYLFLFLNLTEQNRDFWSPYLQKVKITFFVSKYRKRIIKSLLVTKQIIYLKRDESFSSSNESTRFEENWNYSNFREVV